MSISRVMLAAGGTAGHINPALAIADKLKEVFPNVEIMFVGTPDGMEAKLVAKAGYAFSSFKMAGLQRKLSVKNLGRNAKAAYYYVSAGHSAKKLIKSFKPDVVIGTGGYVSAPLLQTAAKMGIKTATHESNSLPGMTTKMLSKYVDKIFVANEDAIAHLHNHERCVITGNPLRSNIPIEEKSAARKRLGLPDGLTILSFGGSLGANKISEGICALLGWENKHGGINHIHSYGGNGREVFEEMLKKSGTVPDKTRTIIKEYIDNMYTCMCAADLIIARAGAMTITELLAIGRPSVLIPFPQAAENHQYYNALTLQKNGAAVLIEDKFLTKAGLVGIVSDLCNDADKLEKMAASAKRMGITDAASRIVSELIDLTK